MARTRSRHERERRYTEDEVRVCPSCAAEFFAHLEVCSDCRVALVAPPEPLAPLALEDDLYRVFASTRPQSIRDAADALTLASIRHRLLDDRVSLERELGTSTLVSLSVLAREEDVAAATRVIDVLAEDLSRSPEAIVALAETRPLAKELRGSIIDADLLAATEYRETGDLDIPAEINRWVVLSYVISAVCWFLSFAAYIQVRQHNEPLWWSGVALTIAAALASHAKGRAIR